MINKLLTWLDKHGRRRIVMDRVNNEPYLERYYVFLKDRKTFPFNIFIHKFLKSDPDDLHDHPWSYFTFILKGGYYEWIPGINCEVRKWRGPGHFRVCRAESLHRIELKPGVTCWTVFMPFTKVREWGFITKGKWVQWEEYLARRLFK
ncbi:hypothetical protein UFOVP112_41 [uncultured Caudovirales phage]|uniref:Uncharacterized protein n=1 Tax=uncultured Caudovirales phage TaxID=2100421 RepID=A0A6J5L9T5_9CAUD|nr:hypothetical protein UFOVP112_41 [uncultured Caudovirales phage]